MQSHDPFLLRLLWADDGATQSAVLFVLAVAFVSFAFVYAPLIVRLIRIGMLDRSMRRASRSDHLSHDARQDMMAMLAGRSPLAWHWTQFATRWVGAQLPEQQVRAPVRLLEVFDEQPLLPTGIRRSLLPALPGILLAVGVIGSFIGLTQSATTAAGGNEVAGMVSTGQLALALHSSIWGLLLALGANVTGRVLQGGFDYRSASLDRSVAHAFTTVSPGELASLAAQAQRQSVQQLGNELAQFTNDLAQRLDRGLQRIERSTASAANLVSQEQRSVLENVVHELSQQVQRGVEQHLGSLHEMLARTVDQQGAVTGALSETFDQLTQDAQRHARVTHALQQAGVSVESASASLSNTARDFRPLLESLRETSGSMLQTVGVMNSTQQAVSRGAEGVRGSIEQAATTMREQRAFMESGLGEIRGALETMNTGLGESLGEALRNVDDALDKTVGRLRDTILSSNDTIERMAGPVRAAEDTTLELHTVLERVRGEVAGLGERLGQAIEPVSVTLGALEGRANDITYALVDFGDRSRDVDQTIQGLRGEIHDHGRTFSQSSTELVHQLRETSDALQSFEHTPPTPSPSQDAVTACSAAAPIAADLPEDTPPEVEGDDAVGESAPVTSQSAAGQTPAQEDSGVSKYPWTGRNASAIPQSGDTPSALGRGTAAGRALGPDPYARAAAESSEPEASQPNEFRQPGNAAGFNGPDELTLSGLLNARKGATRGNGAAPPSDPPNAATPGSEPDDDAEA